MVSQMSRYSKFPLIAVAFSIGAVFSPSRHVLCVMSRCLLNIAKRSLLRLMLSCVGLASKHAAG